MTSELILSDYGDLQARRGRHRLCPGAVEYAGRCFCVGVFAHVDGEFFDYNDTGGLENEIMNHGFRAVLTQELREKAEDLVRHERNTRLPLRLTVAEMLAVRVYTGTRVQDTFRWDMLTCAARQWPELCTALYLAIRKLDCPSILGNIRSAGEMFCGYRHCTVGACPELLYFATALSLSNNREVAESYALDMRGSTVPDKALLITVKMPSDIQHVCGDVSWISRFPREDEVIVSPFTQFALLENGGRDVMDVGTTMEHLKLKLVVPGADLRYYHGLSDCDSRAILAPLTHICEYPARRTSSSAVTETTATEALVWRGSFSLHFFGMPCNCTGVAALGNGDLVVSKFHEHRKPGDPLDTVELFSPSNRQFTVIASRGLELNSPAGLCAENYTHFLVADSGNKRVQRFCVDGSGAVLTIGVRGSAAGSQRRRAPRSMAGSTSRTRTLTVCCVRKQACACSVFARTAAALC